LKRAQQNLNKALFEAAVILAAVALGRDLRSMAQPLSHICLSGPEESVSTLDAKPNHGKTGTASSSRNNSPKFQVNTCFVMKSHASRIL